MNGHDNKYVETKFSGHILVGLSTRRQTPKTPPIEHLNADPPRELDPVGGERRPLHIEVHKCLAITLNIQNCLSLGLARS